MEEVISVDVKIDRVIDHGTIVQLFGHDDEGDAQIISFDHRMFQIMWDDLNDAQQSGEAFIEIDW